MSKITNFKKNGLADEIETNNNPEFLDIDLFESEKAEIDECKLIYLQQEKMLKQRKFDGLLVEAIDEALTSLGIPVKNELFVQLENRFNVSKDEIPKHIDEFSDFLYKTFGMGAAHLEIKFMQNLHSKINVNIQVRENELSESKLSTENMTFENYVYNASKNYCNS